MAGIREPFEIIDKATAPLNRMANAFAGAAAQAQGLDVATAGSNASLDALSASVNGISGKLTAGFSQVVTVLTEISTRIKDANGAMAAMSSTASASITGGVTQPAERAAEAEKAVKKAAEEMGDSVDKAGKKAKNATDKAADSAGDLMNKLKGAAAALGGFAAVKGFVELSDTMSQTQARIRNVTNSLEEAREAQELIYQAAQRSRGDYVQMMQTAAGLKAQTGDTFASIKEATAFTELLQKQFKLAGADATAVSSTMYNLTQALSTGVLRGQDLNIVMANAPQIAQRIAETMGLTVGQLKEVAAKGEVTADIVKRAMLGSADDINAQFANLPMTFGDAMQKLKNVGVKALQPMTQAFANAIASPQFDAAMTAVSQGFITLANIGGAAFNALGTAVQFASDHLAIVSPVLGGIVAGIIAYNAVMGIATAITAAHTGVQTIATGAKTLYALATAAATGNQVAFNAALAACPITWIVGAIVAAIIVVGVLIAFFHNLAATGHTVFGDIAGFAVGCFYVIIDALATMGNFFLGVWEGIVNAFWQAVNSMQSGIIGFAQGAIRAFASVVRGAENAANAIATAFVNGANAAIGGINALINAINQIPGVNIGTVGTIGAPALNNDLSSAIEGVAASLDSLKPGDYQPISIERFNTMSAGDAFQMGFDRGSAWGDNAQNSLTSAFSGFAGDVSQFMGGGDISDLLAGQSDLADAMGGGAGSGGKGKVGSVDKVKKVENCKLSDEDLKIYRDLAERKYQNRIELQTLAPNIQVSIPESAAGNLSAQDVADTIAKLLIEQSAAHTAVAHV